MILLTISCKVRARGIRKKTTCWPGLLPRRKEFHAHEADPDSHSARRAGRAPRRRRGAALPTRAAPRRVPDPRGGAAAWLPRRRGGRGGLSARTRGHESARVKRAALRRRG